MTEYNAEWLPASSYFVQWQRTLQTASLYTSSNFVQWQRTLQTASLYTSSNFVQWQTTLQTASLYTSSYFVQWQRTLQTALLYTSSNFVQWQTTLQNGYLPHLASFNDSEGLTGVVLHFVQNTQHRVDRTTNLLLCERKCHLCHVRYILGTKYFHMMDNNLPPALFSVCTLSSVWTLS